STEDSSSTTRIAGLSLACSTSWSFSSAPFLSHHWQFNFKHSSLAYAAAHVHLAAVVLHNALHNPQAKPRAFLALGGDKGLENGLHKLRRNARAGIGQTDP